MRRSRRISLCAFFLLQLLPCPHGQGGPAAAAAAAASIGVNVIIVIVIVIVVIISSTPASVAHCFCGRACGGTFQ